MPIIDEQFREISDKLPAATLRRLPSGAYLVTIPNVLLPRGWNKASATVKFIAPVGYPQAKPDCFWTDPDLRVEGQVQPQASNLTPVPEVNEPALWFSWYTSQWYPNSDSLMTYLNVIRNRFKDAR